MSYMEILSPMSSFISIMIISHEKSTYIEFIISLSQMLFTTIITYFYAKNMELEDKRPEAIQFIKTNRWEKFRTGFKSDQIALFITIAIILIVLGMFLYARAHGINVNVRKIDII